MKKSYLDGLKGKSILITGGTGSFGNSMVETLLTVPDTEIIIFSRDEKKQFDMRNLHDTQRLHFIIGDVREADSVRTVLDDMPVDYIFHAAALKQVPTCEFFPLEGVKTNVIGAYNVMQEAIRHDISKVVILSTDKAAYPINAMGMTKALMEKAMVASSRKLANQNHKKTILCGVRYGNVLYSRGSVIPYFVMLIQQNKVLPITNFNMTRFLLPLSKAIDLVLYAFVEGKNGHMYVRKAPAIMLEVLAQALCELFHHEKGFKEVGTRAGEKMHETLITQEEFARVSDCGEYYEIPPESQGLDYNKYFVSGRNNKPSKAYTSETTEHLSVEQAKELLTTLPELQNVLPR